ALLGIDRLDPLGRDVQRLDQLLVENARAARRDRPERDLLVTGNAELAHEEDIQRRLELASDLEGNRHAPARKAQHYDVVPTAVSAQALRQEPPGLDPVAKASCCRRRHG